MKEPLFSFLLLKAKTKTKFQEKTYKDQAKIQIFSFIGQGGLLVKMPAKFKTKT